MIYTPKGKFIFTARLKLNSYYKLYYVQIRLAFYFQPFTGAKCKCPKTRWYFIIFQGLVAWFKRVVRMVKTKDSADYVLPITNPPKRDKEFEPQAMKEFYINANIIRLSGNAGIPADIFRTLATRPARVIQFSKRVIIKQTGCQGTRSTELVYTKLSNRV
jgi:hypothetical protein